MWTMEKHIVYKYKNHGKMHMTQADIKDLNLPPCKDVLDLFFTDS
jgi:hypothetical protein